MKTLAFAILSLVPLTAFAQDFTAAICTQTYSYSGGYSVKLRIDDAVSELASVTLRHYRGPDGDGYDQAAQTQLATLDASSTPTAVVYTLADGKKLELTPKKPGGFLVTPQYRYELSCQFASPASKPFVAVEKCADALAPKNGNLVIRDHSGSLLRGFESAMYTESSVTRASLVLETVKKAYFYSETSDISASLYVCDKTAGTVKELLQSHSINCSDLTHEAQGNDAVLYSSCK